MGKERIVIFEVGRREGILWLWEFVATWGKRLGQEGQGGMNERKERSVPIPRFSQKWGPL